MKPDNGKKKKEKFMKKSRGEKKVAKVIREYSKGKLHSGSKRGPLVRNKKQAQAIAMSEAGKDRKKRGS